MTVTLIEKFGRLRRQRKLGLFFEAVTLLAWIRIGLVSMSMHQVRRGLDWWTRRKAATMQEDEIEEKVLWAVGQAILVIPGSLCLPQALLAHALLARRGLTTQLRVGLQAKDDGSMAAHAWLERNQKVLLGGDESPMTHQTIPLSMVDRGSA